MRKKEAQVLRSAATQLGIDVNKYATRIANGYRWCSLGKHWHYKPTIKRRNSVWCGPHEWEYRKERKSKSILATDGHGSHESGPVCHAA